MTFKTSHLKAASVLLAGSVVGTSCVGSFMLSHKFANWQNTATDNKFLNEIIFIFTSVAYAVTVPADVLVLNTMEFWSGSNPLAKNEGKTQQVMGQDGRYYAVTTLRNGYEVKSPDGKVTKFIHDAKTDSWSQVEDGKTAEIFRFNPDGTIQAALPGGGSVAVSQDQAGLFEYRMAAQGATFWAMR